MNPQIEFVIKYEHEVTQTQIGLLTIANKIRNKEQEKHKTSSESLLNYTYPLRQNKEKGEKA